MHLSRESFQDWIRGQEQDPRLQLYKDFSRYYYGDFDKINLPGHIEEALAADIAVTPNRCKIVIDAKAQYICAGPIGIKVLPGQEADAVIDDHESFLYDVYRRNGLLYKNMLKAIRVLSTKGDVYLRAYVEDEEKKSWLARFWQAVKGQPRGEQKYHDFIQALRVAVVKPDTVFPFYSSDDYDEMEMCTVKYYEYDDAGEKQWRAQVWYPDMIELWTLETIQEGDTPRAEWTFTSDEENKLGFIPIVPIKNSIDTREFGVSDLQVMTGLQDNLNKEWTDMLLAMDYQTFQRIAIIGGMMPEGKQLDVGPGRWVDIPNPDAKLEVIDAADIMPYVEAIKLMNQTISEVTQIPQVALGTIEGGIPSGYALRIHYQPLENKSNETLIVLQEGFNKLNYMLFAMARMNDMENLSILDSEIIFNSGLPIDKQALVEQHVKQLTNKTLSRHTAMEEEGVEDIDAEKELMAEDEFDIYGGAQRSVQEAEALARQLEAGGLITQPAVSEVSAAERARATEPPPVIGG